MKTIVQYIIINTSPNISKGKQIVKLITLNNDDFEYFTFCYKLYSINVSNVVWMINMMMITIIKIQTRKMTISNKSWKAVVYE